MPIALRPKLLVPLAVLVLALALPAAAGATLAFVRNPSHPVVYAAADDGSGAHRIARGEGPHVSPDGEMVAFSVEGPGHRPELKLAPAASGPARRLMVNWRETSSLAFSPDSKTIAALRGPELGKEKLVLIDVASGAQRVVASGYFGGFSFSPDGSEIVYSLAASERFPPRSDVYRSEIEGSGKVFVRAPRPVRLTHDHRSSDPLWGPAGKIVFVRALDAKKRRYGPKNELFLMTPQGRSVERLTHTRVPELLQGLFPTDWSANGSRLLAEFEGQDTSYAVAVNPKTGAQRPIAEAGEAGFVGTALSADGRLVLGFTGGFEPGPRHDVVAIPYLGGKPRVLAKGAFAPAWNR